MASGVVRLTPETIAFGVCVVALGSAAAPPATPELASAEVSYAWPTCIPHNMGMCRHPKSCQEPQGLAAHLSCSLQHSGNTPFFFFFSTESVPQIKCPDFLLVHCAKETQPGSVNEAAPKCRSMGAFPWCFMVEDRLLWGRRPWVFVCFHE